MARWRSPFVAQRLAGETTARRVFNCLIFNKGFFFFEKRRKAPDRLSSEIALKFKIKQSKNSKTQFFVFAKELWRVANDCTQKASQYIAVCVVHYSELALISAVRTDKVLAWLSFRKIYVLKASFSKNLLQITDKNFFPGYKLAQWILRRTFPSHYKRSRFWNVNFLRETTLLRMICTHHSSHRWQQQQHSPPFPTVS